MGSSAGAGGGASGGVLELDCGGARCGRSFADQPLWKSEKHKLNMGSRVLQTPYDGPSAQSSSREMVARGCNGARTGLGKPGGRDGTLIGLGKPGGRDGTRGGLGRPGGRQGGAIGLGSPGGRDGTLAPLYAGKGPSLYWSKGLRNAGIRSTSSTLTPVAGSRASLPLPMTPSEPGDGGRRP